MSLRRCNESEALLQIHYSVLTTYSVGKKTAAMLVETLLSKLIKMIGLHIFASLTNMKSNQKHNVFVTVTP